MKQKREQIKEIYLSVYFVNVSVVCWMITSTYMIFNDDDVCFGVGRVTLEPW